MNISLRCKRSLLCWILCNRCIMFICIRDKSLLLVFIHCNDDNLFLYLLYTKYAMIRALCLLHNFAIIRLYTLKHANNVFAVVLLYLIIIFLNNSFNRFIYALLYNLLNAYCLLLTATTVKTPRTK